jgi:hypothetical protein
MYCRVSAPVLLLAIPLSCTATTYWVGNGTDTGAGSLRQAITNANAHPGPDTISFRPQMAGRYIYPKAPLPNVSDDYTTIEADIDGDRAPDVGLNGRDVSAGDGLTVEANHCTISGLAIGAFPGYGLYAKSSDYTTVRSCNLGVTLNGNGQSFCGQADLHLNGCDDCVIGGSASARNVFSGGDTSRCGIDLVDGNRNVIAGNYFAIRRDGSRTLGFGYKGIVLRRFAGTCSENVIGGASAAKRNVFGRMGWGIECTGATSNRIRGNYIGLLPDGETASGTTMSAVLLGADCAGNVIGGTTAGARNVVVGSGVDIRDTTGSNTICGNYFGFNAAGTKLKEMAIGVDVDAPGSQTIGGNTPAAGNWFAASAASYVVTYGVVLTGGGGAASLIRYNHCGVRPAGGNVQGLWNGIAVMEVSARVLDNEIANAGYGILASKAGATPVIARNTIRHCGWAVYIEEGARPCLGNLGDARASNDGGNVFGGSNSMFIGNETPNAIKAEGNDFGTTVRADISAKIHDKEDDGSLGRVDFTPLLGGITPTGGVLTVSGAAVASARGGAEVLFTLSSPAEVSVTVLNLAGRPVATVCRGRPLGPGVQRLLWSGTSNQGTPVPSGAYVLTITARNSDGQQASATARLVLTR